MPPVQAVFYNGDQVVHTEDIPAQDTEVPVGIEEGKSMYSANAEISGAVVMPGLEGFAELGEEQDRHYALMRDEATGEVRGIFRDWTDPSVAAYPIRIRGRINTLERG